MKKTTLSAIIIALIFGYGVFTAPDVAEASCSYNGYLHSGGKCLVSHRGGDDDDDDDRWEHRSSKKHGNRYYYSQSTDITYLNRYIQELLLILSQYRVNNNIDSNQSDIEVSTQSATNIDDDRATVRAIVDMNNEDDGDLYFDYGRNINNLSSRTSTQNLNADDDGDTLEETITGLDDNTRYYYRAVVVDENGDKDYGVTYSFITDNSSSNDEIEPDVTTQDARDINDDSAELRGTIDMNDFENGIAFFVYGEDEDDVRDVEDENNTYTEVTEQGSDLQKVLVDSDVDGTDTFTIDIDGLDDNTDIFHTFCVEYEDNDDDETLVCGSVEKFTTD